MTSRVYTEAEIAKAYEKVHSNLPPFSASLFRAFLKAKDKSALPELPEELELVLRESSPNPLHFERYKREAQLTISAAVEAACERMRQSQVAYVDSLVNLEVRLKSLERDPLPRRDEAEVGRIARNFCSQMLTSTGPRGPYESWEDKRDKCAANLAALILGGSK